MYWWAVRKQIVDVSSQSVQKTRYLAQQTNYYSNATHLFEHALFPRKFVNSEARTDRRFVRSFDSAV